jgi:hypothetical protein
VYAGFFSVEVSPSPKFHAQLVIAAVDVEVSVKVTSRITVPLAGVNVKSATGALVAAVTLIKVTCVERFDPALLLAFNTME